MQVVKVRFGQSHAATRVGAKYRGRQSVQLACNPVGPEITYANQKYFELVLDTTGARVVCIECRKALGLDEEESVNGNHRSPA